jgi:hypothetical protein
MMRRAAALILALAAATGPAAGEPPLALQVQGVHYRQDVVSAFVLPGEPITIKAPPETLRLLRGDELIPHEAPGVWTWYPPRAPSLHALRLSSPEGQKRAELNIFVMVPASRVAGGVLNGYRIGRYPDRPLGGKAAYRNPRGFVEVTKENRETLLSPHFRLEQFLCKQASDFPKYVVVNERLIAKLERVLAAVHERKIKCKTLHVMSGYRTPFYNQAIENVKYSQHVFGGAADVFVDDNNDDLMDDLNADGIVNKDDARVLFDIVNALDRQPKAEDVGGLGVYGGTAAHGPFVHVDVRGTLARWGQ